MADNNFDSNITQKLMRVFLEKFESVRVLSKNVNTQLLSGAFNPSTGDEVNFKRPTDYVAVETTDGDLSSVTPLQSDIITGKAKGVVQKYISVNVEFKQVDQALKMDQLDQLLAPMATRIVTQLELNFARFMMKNSGLRAGAPGTAVSTWSDIANWGATMTASGIPMDGGWFAGVNPFTQVVLANLQQGLQSGGAAGSLISDAFRQATIVENFAGMKVMAATTLASYLLPGDVAGALTAVPTLTYLAAKDSMTQSLAVGSFENDSTIKAGTTVTIAGVSRLNLSTREVMIDAAGVAVPWTATVVADAVMSTTGTGTLIVTGPLIFEANGQYNTASNAPSSSAVVTLGGSTDATLQPNLFWHKDAFGIGSVPLDKLFATDTLAQTEDGLQLRVTKFSDGVKNLQKVRFDFLPAFAALNPFFSGQGFG